MQVQGQRVKHRMATFNINHSVADSTPTINPCFIAEASYFCSQVAKLSIEKLDVSAEPISLSVSLSLTFVL